MEKNYSRDDVLNSFWKQKFPSIYPRLHDSLDTTLADLRSLLDEHWDRYIGMANLAASECIPNEASLAASGSILGAQTVEGLSGNRWFPGTFVADRTEQVIADYSEQIFQLGLASAQPHSATQANQAVALSSLEIGDTILAMSFKEGGHISHGFGNSLLARLYNVETYGLDPDSHEVDFSGLAREIEIHRPKLVISGSSSYPRAIDFGKIQSICHQYGVLHMADISHVAGLIAADVLEDSSGNLVSVESADFATFSTHKTMLGVRGGIVLSRKELVEGLQNAVFPQLQSAVLPNLLLAKAYSFGNASSRQFRFLQKRILENSRFLSDQLSAHGLDVWTGGTDTHIICIRLPRRRNAREVCLDLFNNGIISNPNFLPGDENVPTGIRIGTTVVSQLGIGHTGLNVLAEVMRDAVLFGQGSKFEGNKAVVKDVIEDLILNRRAL